MISTKICWNKSLAKWYFNHVTALLRQLPRLLASPLQVTRFRHPGAGQEQDIYTHREKRGGTNWSRLGCVAVCLEMAEVAEFAIGFLFHASCACLWSQHWLRRKISTINGSIKIVQVVFLCFSLINWCFKMQLTWHSNHGTKKKYVTTESNKKIIKDIDW